MHADRSAWPSARTSTLLTGAEDGSIRLWNTVHGNEPALVIPRAHASRVRAVIPLSGASADGPALVGSASSDGVVRIWDLQKLTAQAAESGARQSSKPLESLT